MQREGFNADESGQGARAMAALVRRAAARTAPTDRVGLPERQRSASGGARRRAICARDHARHPGRGSAGSPRPGLTRQRITQ